MTVKRPILLLIDGSGYIFRAYYGVRHHLSNSKGVPTNAVFGFTTMLRKVLTDMAPAGVAVAFDTKEKTARHKIYPEYKANRGPPPEDLVPQFVWIHKITDAFRVQHFALPGYEADDIIATLAERGIAAGFDVRIVSADKDLMQLVSDRVILVDTMKDVTYDSAGVEAKFGVPPEQVGDLLALTGDTSDNVPGVPGVGEKTAQQLLRTYGSLEAILRAAPNIEKAKLRENLVQYAETARTARKLVTLDANVPGLPEIPALATPEPDQQALAEIFQELEFRTLSKQWGLDALQGGAETQGNQAPVEAAGAADKAVRYSCVDTDAALRELAKRCASVDRIGFDTETTGIDPMAAELVGMSISPGHGESYYVPLGHSYLGVGKQLDLQKTMAALRPVLEAEKPGKCGHNIKYDWVVMAQHGVHIGGVDGDSLVGSFILNPELPGHGLKLATKHYLGESMTAYEDLTRKGRSEINFREVPIADAAKYSCADADMSLRLVKLLEQRLESSTASALYREIEIPLIPVLGRMEAAGITLDVGRLKDLGARLGHDIEVVAERIYGLAGRKFNINSPKQLAELLFGELGLPVVKRTKSGPSTDVDVLNELSEQSELASEILAYRSLAKLKNTYVDTLPQLVNKRTGRIHTTFSMTTAETGRLSSVNPNLQNIPVRTSVGREIREAFVAAPGMALISADYSQIELRVFAHMADEPALIEAFRLGRDIHTETAVRVFDTGAKHVTPEQRRQAKTINFAVLYGQSAFSLSRDLHISRTEAQALIDGYFERYPKVRQFIDETIRRCENEGGVRTMFGRWRPLEGIQSKNRQRRHEAERIAVNTPIQGTAAEIIKKAMIDVDTVLTKQYPEARMLLQVHDELLVECPKESTNEVMQMVVKCMEDAVTLKAPLKVEAQSGPNWSVAH